MSPFHRGLVHAALGRVDEALDDLMAGDPWPWDQTLYLRYTHSGPLEAVRADPRFRAVLEALDRSWSGTPS